MAKTRSALQGGAWSRMALVNSPTAAPPGTASQIVAIQPGITVRGNHRPALNHRTKVATVPIPVANLAVGASAMTEAPRAMKLTKLTTTAKAWLKEGFNDTAHPERTKSVPAKKKKEARQP